MWTCKTSAHLGSTNAQYSVYNFNMSGVLPFHGRLLGDLDSSPYLKSYSLLTLAAVVGGLILILGLTMVARCAWFNHAREPSTSTNKAAANKGLKKKILNALPKQTCTPDEASKLSDCAICLATFVSGDEIRVLPVCGHCYHVMCIDTWLQKHSSCPSCRQILAGNKCGTCINTGVGGRHGILHTPNLLIV